eukprot:CAMPEP_0204411056 /NCGR_PEP_ID=MMETSP0470-20130426/11120_1 /ASSEMBLY_ACC=CAM_ASM_000385 /TAXON_ID=2969 /ORGANISM="Oxyrrhis marina" /LENGTH=95 /DNA_ID=CAMNT_0051406997 /DNA_START=199 /DNA_END=483 /DNA_ORIENTATION=-
MSLALTTGSGAKDIMPCATPSPRGGFQVGPRAVCVNPLATWAPRCSRPALSIGNACPPRRSVAPRPALATRSSILSTGVAAKAQLTHAQAAERMA